MFGGSGVRGEARTVDLFFVAAAIDRLVSRRLAPVVGAQIYAWVGGGETGNGDNSGGGLPGLHHMFGYQYSKISLVRYRLFGRAYHNANGIVISRVTRWVNK